jgi:hypothetical protein
VIIQHILILKTRGPRVLTIPHVRSSPGVRISSMQDSQLQALHKEAAGFDQSQSKTV